MSAESQSRRQERRQEIKAKFQTVDHPGGHFNVLAVKAEPSPNMRRDMVSLAHRSMWREVLAQS